MGFERCVIILFRVEKEQVEILRILYGGRDLEEELKKSYREFRVHSLTL
jgi:plasmid stabilization system protein ParE